jgi:hypothetical protein
MLEQRKAGDDGIVQKDILLEYQPTSQTSLGKADFLNFQDKILTYMKFVE